MKITTLIENLVYKEGLVAEHGLSILFETQNRIILFDTGQSGLFIQNAVKLGIDLKKVDALVISHGHYDHTGGISAFLKINKHARVYAKREIFNMKFNGFKSYIGIPPETVIPRRRLTLVETVTELDEGFFIVPEIPVKNLEDTRYANFFIRKGGGFLPDEFDDELFLASSSDGSVSVFSSCSHRGITNIIVEATRYFGLPLGLVLGGFHMKEADAENLGMVASFFKQIMPRQIGVCHCSGMGTYSLLKSELHEKVFYNMTGNSLPI